MDLMEERGHPFLGAVEITLQAVAFELSSVFDRGADTEIGEHSPERMGGEFEGLGIDPVEGLLNVPHQSIRADLEEIHEFVEKIEVVTDDLHQRPKVERAEDG
jgi:hypothetical protein